MIDYKKLFSCFPVIEDQFDLVAIDCVKISQQTDQFYVPIIRFMIRNHEEKKVDAGLTIRTGAVCNELVDVALFVNTMGKIGFFISDICAYGTVYDESMNELEDVNWNNVIKFATEDAEQYKHEEQKQTFLH